MTVRPAEDGDAGPGLRYPSDFGWPPPIDSVRGLTVLGSDCL